MKTNGYVRGKNVQVHLFSLECGRCGSSLTSERQGSYDLSLGDDFTLDGKGDYQRACEYSGARVSVPHALMPFLV